MANLGFHPELVDMFTEKGFEMVNKERVNLGKPVKIKAPRKSDLGFRQVGRKDDTGNIHFQPESAYLHKGNDSVKPYGYKRDILFGSKGSRSTGHLKDF